MTPEATGAPISTIRVRPTSWRNIRATVATMVRAFWT